MFMCLCTRYRTDFDMFVAYPVGIELRGNCSELRPNSFHRLKKDYDEREVVACTTLPCPLNDVVG
jgi:hypothetical protein